MPPSHPDDKLAHPSQERITQGGDCEQQHQRKYPDEAVRFSLRRRKPLRLAVRGLALVLALVAVVVSPPHPVASANPSTPKTIKVIVYGSPTTTTTTTVPESLAGLPRPVAQPVSPEIMAKWQKVAQCESGGRWYQVYSGSRSFSGALGIRNDVWLEHGGGEFGPTAGNASPMEQVIVARRIQARGGVPDYVPDQDGKCRGW